MLYIRTGLPGNGKTLNTIKEVDSKAKTEGRIVYFHNVAGLDPSKLQAQWFEFDNPLKWHELPHNAIVVVDEAQGSTAAPMFGVRDPRQAVPAHITAFETMRHRGHEVHLITQDPRFIDVHARRLCNKHIHYWRIFGSSKISRYETERVVNDVEKLSSFSQSSRTVITLDKKYFGVYTSSQGEHHFKFRPSRKFVLSALAIVAAVVASFVVYDRVIASKISPAEVVPAAPGRDGAVSLGEEVKSKAKALLPDIAGASGAAPPVTPAQYLAQRKPRVDNLPASAPVFDGLTEAKAFPRLYCMSSSDVDNYARNAGRMSRGVVNGSPTVCQCYSQQGTKINTSFDFCLSAVRDGYFDPTRPDRGGPNDFDAPGSAPGALPAVDAPADVLAPAQLKVSGVKYVPEPRTLK